MILSDLPLELLVEVFCQKEDVPASFPHALLTAGRRECLRQIARTVFERMKVRHEGELKASQTLELIALIVSKTYASQGDSFQLADDEALARIYDLLLEHDPHTVRRHLLKGVNEEQLEMQMWDRNALVE
jgi:hypothetical protein